MYARIYLLLMCIYLHMYLFIRGLLNDAVRSSHFDSLNVCDWLIRYRTTVLDMFTVWGMFDIRDYSGVWSSRKTS
jgi:hypothetical protein